MADVVVDRKEVPVIMIVGNKVVYPCQGPCIIDTVIVRVVAGGQKSFYRLIVLDDTGGELFVPVDKVHAIGIRPLLNKSEIPRLLDHLMKTTKIAKHWKQRSDDILKLFISGSAFDLAEIVDSLTELSRAKELSLRDNWTLRRARKLLVCEISEVMGETKNVAEEWVDQALRARKIAGINEIPDRLPIGKLSQSV
jgi:CarD family transcriptional regulator, regulator of rRNA transcription